MHGLQRLELYQGFKPHWRDEHPVIALFVGATRLRVSRITLRRHAGMTDDSYVTLYRNTAGSLGT
jgi:hypothetical protein